jgi:hypothetical protein
MSHIFLSTAIRVRMLLNFLARSAAVRASGKPNWKCGRSPMNYRAKPVRIAPFQVVSFLFLLNPTYREHFLLTPRMSA